MRHIAQPAASRHGKTNVILPADGAFGPQDLLWITRLARELRLTDQILATDLDTVSVVPQGPAPAWTSLEGDHISFSMAHMPVPINKVDIAVWLGTNAHELGHVLFSPRRESSLMQRVMEADQLFLKGIIQLHNIVEDQREERLLLARFSPWRDYLTAALAHHLKIKDSTGAWLLVCGRTWLSSQVRGIARAIFVKSRGESTAREVAELVGKYQLLTDPGESESDEALDILTRLHGVFDLDIPPGGCGGGVIVDGEPNTDPNPGDLPTAGEADGQQPGEGEGEAGGKGDGDGDQPGQGESSEPSTGKGGTGVGKGPSQPPKLDQKELRKQLKEEARKGLEQDPEVKADMDSVLDAVRNGRAGLDDIEGNLPEGRWRQASDAARRLRTEVAEALLEFKEDSEPGWVRHVSSGRLKVQRLLNPRVDADTLFDRYEPGQMDSSELELVVVLDVSGSMTSQLKPLSEANWAIWHAVDDLEGDCTIFTFSSGPHRVLARPGDRPDDRMFRFDSWGGTDPDSALLEAYTILATSQIHNRMAVMLTDGAWAGQRGDEIIAAMRLAGVTTIMAYLPTGDMLPGYKPESLAHGAEFFQEIGAPADLAIMFRDVALAKMKGGV